MRLTRKSVKRGEESAVTSMESSTFTMIRAASKVYLLADSSKIGSPSFASLGRITLIDTLITDSKIDPVMASRIESLGVKVLIPSREDNA